MIRRKQSIHGFSLLELMAVVTIIGILVLLVLARVSSNVGNAKMKTCFHNRTEINSTLERYAFDQGAPATAISDLNDPNYLPDGVPPCPVTGGAYTMDPGTNTVLGHTSNTSPGDH